MRNQLFLRGIAVFSAAVISMICIPYQIPADKAAAADNDWNTAYYNMILASRDTAEYYDLYDINADGVPELFLSSQGTRGMMNVELYTYSGDKVSFCQTLFPTALYADTYNDMLLVCTSLMYSGTGLGENHTECFELVGNSLHAFFSYYTTIENGVITGYYCGDEPFSAEVYEALTSPFDPIRKGYPQIGQTYHISLLSSTWAEAIENADRGIRDHGHADWQNAYAALLCGANVKGRYETFTLSDRQRTDYELVDLDRNGIPELFAVNKEPDYYSFDQPLIFTFYQGELLELELDPSGFLFGWNSIYSGNVFVNEDAGYVTDAGHNVFFKYDGTSLILKAVFRETADGYRYNDQLVSIAEYDRQYQPYVSIAENSYPLVYETPLEKYSLVYDYDNSYMFDYSLTDSGIRINGFANEYTADTLSELRIPEQIGDDYVVEIADHAFCNLENLQAIYLPDTPPYMKIGDGAFSNLSLLKTVRLPFTAFEIGNGAFSMCCSLQEYQFLEDPSMCSVLDGVIYSKDMTTLIRYPSGKNINSFSFPASVKKIAD